MVTHRLFGLISLLLLTVMVWASPLTSRRLSDDRFHDSDWIILKDENSDTRISQIWRQPLRNVPKGVDSYEMVSYQVQSANSAQDALLRAQTLLEKKRFNEYRIKGYDIEMKIWDVAGQHTAEFLVYGLNRSADVTTAHRAEIYTLAMAQDTWVIWLEVRLVSTASEQDAADRSLQKAGGSALAEKLVNEIIRLWIPEQQPSHPGVGTVAPTSPATPPAVKPPTPPITPATPTPAVKPPVPTTTTPTTAPTTNSPTSPAIPTTPAPVVKPPTPPVTPPTPPVTPPTPAPAVTSPPLTATPTTPTGQRWQTEDGLLTFVLPKDWSVMGKRPHPYIFSGLPNATIRLYQVESYANDAEFKKVVDDFVASQQEVSASHFTRQDYQVAGANGVLVQYTNFAKHTIVSYYFGQAGHLWRFEVELAGENARLPALISELMVHVRITPGN